MGKRGKRGDKPKAKKVILKRLDALVKKLEKEAKDLDLFAPPPPTDDCGICLVPLPRVGEKNYKYCCGKHICTACIQENRRVNSNNVGICGEKIVALTALTCPFCRVLEPTCKVQSEEEKAWLRTAINLREEHIRQLEVRSSKGDGTAYSCLGDIYYKGYFDLDKDEMKALHYFILGAELGSSEACGNIGMVLGEGKGVPVDKVKAASFYRAGALRGDVACRHIIGDLEYDEFSNHELGIRHWKIAASAGCQPSLNSLRDIYNANGNKPGKEFIGKDELDSIYRAGHEAQQEVKTEEREKHFEGAGEIFKC